MEAVEEPTAATGIAGLDIVLGGGFPRDHVYLIQGDPGAGKTTLSLQFLLEGVKLGEKGLYITLSETKRELEVVARSHGWSLDGIEIHEQLVTEDVLSQEEDTTMFHPAEIELGQAVTRMLEEVERVKPQRVVIDSLAEIRLLSQSTLRYRKQILALKQYFPNRGATVLFLDDRTAERNDLQLHSVPHGVLVLERRAPLYGSPRRRLEIVKLRGVDFGGGYHDFNIRRGGIELYPRLIAAHHPADSEDRVVSSGIAEVDALLGGGLESGSSTLIIGPAGAGKSTLATQFAVAAAERGEKAAFFIFDESRKRLMKRSTSLGMNLAAHLEKGNITAQQVDPAELAPGEFAQLVRAAVEKEKAQTIVIDSLNGYLNAMPEERFLTLHLHEMLTYLSDHGVATILVMAQHGLIGANMISSVDVSYLADCVVLLRYYEADGELHKAISVMKKRGSDHEKAIREFRMTSTGIVVGEPLRQFRGILSGIPIAEER
ncbi:MAG TPA: ATPase domain-containing protein [Thermoanaerobaculia bacterium]|nr:ATPase domain-containing protein [Thermoanaerobaculia bacterium]